MPSLSEMTEVDWARMDATTFILTYRILERLQSGPKPKDQFTAAEQAHFSLLIKAKWIVSQDDETVVITESALRHLRSF